MNRIDVKIHEYLATNVFRLLPCLGVDSFIRIGTQCYDMNDNKMVGMGINPLCRPANVVNGTTTGLALTN